MFGRWKFKTEARSKRLKSNRERVKSSFSVTKGRVNFRYLQNHSYSPLFHSSSATFLSQFLCNLNVGIFQGLLTFSLLKLIAFICYLIKMLFCESFCVLSLWDTSWSHNSHVFISSNYRFINYSFGNPSIVSYTIKKKKLVLNADNEKKKKKDTAIIKFMIIWFDKLKGFLIILTALC